MTDYVKDAGLRIRVQRDLREQFLEVCRAQDKPAAQVLREFMRWCGAASANRSCPPTAAASSLAKGLISKIKKDLGL